MRRRRFLPTPALVFSGVAAVLMAGCGKPDNAAPPTPAVTAAPTPAVAEAPPPPAAEAAPPVAAAEVDDATLATRVRTALQADPEVQGLAIDVTADQGTVLLSGFVDSRTQTDKAGSIAGAVDGVRRVDNRLDMKTGSAASGPTEGDVAAAEPDDAAITRQIESALVGDPYLGETKISVVTRNGEVQLSGFVPSQDQADDVLAIAHRLDGVKGVVSTLTVGQGEQQQ